MIPSLAILLALAGATNPAAPADPGPGRETSWLVVAAPFSNPETGLGGAVKFWARDLGGVPLGLDVTLAATLRKQVSLGLDLARDSVMGAWKWTLGLDVGRFPEKWYGRGNPPPDSAEVVYTPDYLVLAASFGRDLPAGWSASGYLQGDWRSVEAPDTLSLAEDLDLVARDGGVFPRVGAKLAHEGRDLPEDPRRGDRFDLDLSTSLPGSDAAWTRGLGELSWTRTLGGRWIGVARLHHEEAWGDVPFWQTPFLGWSKTLRGVPEKRLRGAAAQCAGTEVRWVLPRVWKAVPQLVAFGELGRAGSHGGVWTAGARPAGGFGVRGVVAKRAVLRIDYGWSGSGSGLYVDFGNAF